MSTITAPLAVPGPAGAPSLLTQHQDQGSCPCLGVIFTTLQSVCPHCPVIAVALSSTVTRQETWGSPSCCTLRLQCRLHHLLVGTRGSIPWALEKPKSPMWGRALDLRGKTTVRCQRLLSSLCEPRGRSRVIPSPERLESPSLRPARWRGTAGLSL